MKKQKVLRRKTKKMSNPATVTTALSHPAPVDVHTPQYKSYIGIIVRWVIETEHSPLARAVVFSLPTISKTCTQCGSVLNRDGMQLFCFTCREVTTAPVPSKNTTISSFDPSTVPDYITYDSYVAFCKSVDAKPLTNKEREHYEAYCKELGIEPRTNVEPRSIERWDTTREVDTRIAYKATQIRTPINTYVPYSLTLGNHLARAAKCFRLFRDDLTTPRNVERRFGFGYDKATGKRRITPEWADSEKYDPKAIKPRGERPHASSCQTLKGAPFCTCDGKKIPHWCFGCDEYVDLFHDKEHCNRKDRTRRNEYLQCEWNYSAAAEALHKVQRCNVLVPGAYVTNQNGVVVQLRKVVTTFSPQDYGTPLWPTTPPEAKADWQRELATWPCFVPYKGRVNPCFCPHHWWDARYCTVCACGLGEPNPNVDHLAWVKSDPRTCTHIDGREFTFSTGERIQMCPDCSVPFTSITELPTKLDKARQEVLKKGNIVAYPTVGALALFNARLDAEGLSLWRGFSKQLVYRGTPIALERLGVEKEEEAILGKGRVKTSGIAGTNREGDGARDSCSRDWRGKQMLQDESTHEPLTKSFDPYSGETFWEREGTIYRPGTSHKQRFHEELPDIRVDLQLLQLKSTLLMLKELQEKKQ